MESKSYWYDPGGSENLKIGSKLFIVHDWCKDVLKPVIRMSLGSREWCGAINPPSMFQVSTGRKCCQGSCGYQTIY